MSHVVQLITGRYMIFVNAYCIIIIVCTSLHVGTYTVIQDCKIDFIIFSVMLKLIIHIINMLQIKTPLLFIRKDYR